MLYVAFRTNENSLQPGGHAVVGFGMDLDHPPIYAEGATQLAFDTIANGNQVTIMNEIHEYKVIAPDQTAHYVDSGISGVQAAYSYAGGEWTYEIAIPLWTNWSIGQMTTKFDLTPGDVVYLYAVMENTLNGGNGTNLTYTGNPHFADPNGFLAASTLTLTAPAPGDANGDSRVDVSDLGILAANYGMTAGATWDKGDFNGDGKVDVSDLGILAANYGNRDWDRDNPRLQC